MGPKHKEWDTSIGAWVVKGQSQGKQWVATRASGQPHRKESCLSYSAARSGEGSPFTAPSPAAAPSPDPLGHARLRSVTQVDAGRKVYRQP